MACQTQDYFNSNVCRKAKLATDAGKMDATTCINQCMTDIPQCKGLGLLAFCTGMDNSNSNIEYLYTFHPDPVLYPWQLGNRDWATSNMTYLNAVNPPSADGLPASACLFDAASGGKAKRHYKNSYNYMTRIKIPKGSLASHGKYTAAEDCSCTPQSVSVGLSDTVDEPHYSVCGKSHPTYVLNSPWISLSQSWVDQNIKPGDFQTVHLKTNNQNWYNPQYGFKTAVDKLCSVTDISNFVKFRAHMDTLLDQYFFGPQKLGGPVENVITANYSTLPNFCTGSNLSATQRGNCEINVHPTAPATPAPPGYVGWGCPGHGDCVPAPNYGTFSTTYNTLEQCVANTSCFAKGVQPKCGCSDNCNLTHMNRCYDQYQTLCKGNPNCMVCIQRNPTLQPCRDFLSKYVCK